MDTANALERLRSQMELLDGRLTVVAGRVDSFDASIRTLLQAVTAMSADVRQIRDQMSILEDAQALYACSVPGNDSPPPVAAKPMKNLKPAWRAA